MNLKLLSAIAVSISITACHVEEMNNAQPATPPGEMLQATSSSHPVERPEVVVGTLNALYNSSRNNCREVDTQEPRGYYYCSGVLMRAASDGDYPPWSHSPNTVQLGASSYSWVRHDIQTGEPFSLFGPVGFILRNPEYAAQNRLFGLETGFSCLYPLNAGTVGNSNNHKGCGVQENAVQAIYPQPDAHHHNAADAWGSCEALKITTTEQWFTYFKTHLAYFPAPFNMDQCSWNADSQLGWTNAVAIMQTFRDAPEWQGVIGFQWNELLYNIVDDGSVLKKYIAAFYFEVRESAPGMQSTLDTARTFQRKLNENGYTVPIVRVDFSAPAAQRYSYHPEDQAIAQ